MLNLAVQLQALYQGRKEDVAGLLKEGCDESEKGEDRVRVGDGSLVGSVVADRVGGGAGKEGKDR